MQRLKDRVAIITGGTSGIGRACAEAFANEGATVVVVGRRKQVGEALATSLGHGSVFVAADVGRQSDIESLVAQTLDRFARIDVVVNNAGSVSTTGPIAETDPAAFDHDIAVHVRAPFLAMKYAAPAMAARGGGCFINMSSISAIRAGFNVFGYEVAKGLFDRGVLVAGTLFSAKTIRIEPPLTITQHEMNAAVDTIEKVFKDVNAKHFETQKKLPVRRPA